SVELAVQIFEGLSPATRERIKGTAMAEKQADLKALAGMEAELQGKVLDLVFAYPDQPMALGDAERKARGLPVLNDADKILRATQGGLTRLSKTTRQILFSTYKDEIMEMAKREGWIDG
ncbi:MAG: chromosome partitioning protein ParB, partial [Alphaproteobacteria bacterium]